MLSTFDLNQALFFEDIGTEVIVKEVAVDAAGVYTQKIGTALTLFDDQPTGGVVAEDEQGVGGLVVVVPARAFTEVKAVDE